MKEQDLILRHFKGVIDSTLREGLQFSGADFSIDQQKKIFKYLTLIGVDYVEVGNPAKSAVREMIVQLVRSRNGQATKILSHIRNDEKDLQKALECRVDGVNILCTADPERIEALHRTPQEYVTILERNILTARAEGMEIRVSVEDYFLQPRQFSRAVYDLAERMNVDRIGLADTRGKTLSWDVYRQVRSLRQRYGVGIEGHFHNDLGHAVGNAIAALMAGANWIDTSLLGIGERTGITPLSSLLINLFLLDPKIGERYDLSLLTSAENYVARACHIETPINLSTNRKCGFAHKAGIHLDALIQFGPQKYESLPPYLIGNVRHLVTGSLVSGKTSAEDVASFRKKYERSGPTSSPQLKQKGHTPCS